MLPRLLPTALILFALTACGSSPAASPSTAVLPPSSSTSPPANQSPSLTVRTPLYSSASAPSGAVVPGGQWIAVNGTGGSVMLAEVFIPPGLGPFPAVIVLHGTEGFNQHHALLAQFFAQHGYVGVAACWFGGHYNGGGLSGSGGSGPPPSTNPPEGINCPNGPPLEALQGSATWPDAVTNTKSLIDAVRTIPQVDPNQVALQGHSRGSIAALTVAASGVGVQAVIAADGTPANSYASQVQGAVLIIQGLADTSISPQTVKSFEAALKSAGKVVQDDYVAGAPHTLIWESPWEADAWNRMVSFLQQTLH